MQQILQSKFYDINLRNQKCLWGVLAMKQNAHSVLKDAHGAPSNSFEETPSKMTEAQLKKWRHYKGVSKKKFLRLF